MHNEVNIPSKKWKCSILHKRCPFFSAEQTVRRWRSDGGRPQSDLGWLRSLTNHQHPWLARNVLSGQRNIDFKIECVHYFYSLLCTPLGQCGSRGQLLSMYLFEGRRGAVASTSAAPEQNELSRCQRKSLIKLTLISFCISTDKIKMLFSIEWPRAFHENI